jgi:SagB-type dehydrogenase family enzyme
VVAGRIALVAALLLFSGALDVTGAETEPLPAPDRAGSIPFETLLQTRLSTRAFLPDTLSPAMLGQLLWAACGATRQDLFLHRTVPSAGGLYPLECYLVTSRGVARYIAPLHALDWLATGDRRAEFRDAALRQPWVGAAPAIVVIAAEPQRTKVKYGERGDRYVVMEAGCAAQNVLLEAVALGLAAVPVGAFDDERISRVLALPASQEPLLLIPIGRPAL